MISGTLQDITQITGDLSIKSGCSYLIDSEGNLLVDDDENVLIAFPGNAPVTGTLEDISDMTTIIAALNSL